MALYSSAHRHLGAFGGGEVERITYDGVILDAVDLAPAGHHECVVVGNEDDMVNTLSLELVDVGNVGGEMGAGASRGEGAGNGDDDDLLVGKV